MFRIINITNYASVAQLVDADRLKRSGEIHAGSNPVASNKTIPYN